MVNERIIPLNVKPVEEVAVVDEKEITPVEGRTYVIVYKSFSIVQIGERRSIIHACPQQEPQTGYSKADGGCVIQ